MNVQLTVLNVSRYKRWDCANYESCLSVADSKNWQQFHCNLCDVYVKDSKLTAEARLSAGNNTEDNYIDLLDFGTEDLEEY